MDFKSHSGWREGNMVLETVVSKKVKHIKSHKTHIKLIYQICRIHKTDKIMPTESKWMLKTGKTILVIVLARRRYPLWLQSSGFLKVCTLWMEREKNS